MLSIEEGWFRIGPFWMWQSDQNFPKSDNWIFYLLNQIFPDIFNIVYFLMKFLRKLLTELCNLKFKNHVAKKSVQAFCRIGIKVIGV